MKADAIAYCWASGLIEIKPRCPVPEGAIVIARGPSDKLRRIISGAARLGQGKSAGKLLVPGIPEADSWMDKSKALNAFVQRITTHLQPKEATR